MQVSAATSPLHPKYRHSRTTYSWGGICQSINCGICQFLECGIWQSIDCRLSIYGLCNWQIPSPQIDKSSVYRFTTYGLCAWQIPHSRNWQIAQLMDWLMHQSTNCLSNLLMALRDLSIGILWNNHTIHRLMHLRIHKLRNLSIPRVWNLPSIQSIGCESVVFCAGTGIPTG